MKEKTKEKPGDRSAFFYGTLMSPEILHSVLFRPSTSPPLTTIPAVCPNHSRRHVRNADYPGMVPKSGSSVRGAFATGLTDKDMGKLDIFEGMGPKGQYKKGKVWVRLIPDSEEGDGEGELVEAETYIFIDSKNLEEKEWEYETFAKEKLDRWVGGKLGSNDDSRRRRRGGLLR